MTTALQQERENALVEWYVLKGDVSKYHTKVETSVLSLRGSTKLVDALKEFANERSDLGESVSEVLLNILANALHPERTNAKEIAREELAKRARDGFDAD